MDFDQKNEEHLKILEDYVKRFHLNNDIIDEEAGMLGKLNSYWHRKNVNPKSSRKIRSLRIALKNLIEDFKEELSVNNYEVLDVLYHEIEDIIIYEESKKDKDVCLKFFIYLKDNTLCISVTV